MELETADALVGAQRRLAGAERFRRRKGQQLIARTAEAEEARRVGAIGEIDAYRANRGTVTNPHTDRVDHIIEILKPVLLHAEADIAHIRIDVAHVMEEYAAQVIADQR